MSSKEKSEAFIESMSLWVEQTYKRIKHSTHLADWEKPTAREELIKYGHTLQSYSRILAGDSDLSHEAFEYLLNDLVDTQKEANRIAAFYELPRYSSTEGTGKKSGIELTIKGYSMAPFLEPNDKIHCSPVDRSNLFDFKGLGVLVHRRNRTVSRVYSTGRIEPIQKRLIRLNFDNKAYGHLDRAVPLSEVVMLYRVVQINRAIP